MMFRAHTGDFVQSMRWLAVHSAIATALAAGWGRLRARGTDRLTVSHVSADWLHDHRRRHRSL
jgi:hypothetical protein